MDSYIFKTCEEDGKIYTLKVYRFCTEWYFDNKLHREKRPAIEWFDGRKDWYKNGKYHREDGPTIEFIDGRKEWWLNDKCYGYNNDFKKKSWKKFVSTLVFI